MTEVNAIDEVITEGMFLAEQSIRFHRSNHPWSPTLAKAILDVQFWKIKLSIISNKQSRQTIFDNIINRITHFNHYQTSIHCNNIKQISKYLRESKLHLIDIQSEAINHREVHLNQLVDEEYILGNIKYVRYLRNIITIEHQVALYRNIQSLKKVNDKSGFK